MRALLKSRAVTRAVSVLGIALLTLAMIGASDSTHPRFNQLGHAMMCTCSCSQILLECNHVGCPDSDRMRRELSAALDRGDSDERILKGFTEKYGPVVLAAPTSQGFDRVAWTMPGLVLLLGMAGASMVVYRWRLGRRPGQVEQVPATSSADPRDGELRRRARQETEL